MSAELIQTNKTPFVREDVDPITLDIIENALKNARYEMDGVLFRPLDEIAEPFGCFDICMLEDANRQLHQDRHHRNFG